jgi:hypothetical protein
MPWTSDNLHQPRHTAVFALTIVQLMANATALITGILAQLERQRSREAAR